MSYGCALWWIFSLPTLWRSCKLGYIDLCLAEMLIAKILPEEFQMVCCHSAHVGSASYVLKKLEVDKDRLQRHIVIIKDHSAYLIHIEFNTLYLHPLLLSLKCLALKCGMWVLLLTLTLKSFLYYIFNKHARDLNYIPLLVGSTNVVSKFSF